MRTETGETEGEADLRIRLAAVGLLAEPGDSPEEGADSGYQALLRDDVLSKRAALSDCRSLASANISGTVILALDVLYDGSVLGGSTDPAPGLEELSAVSACVLERSRAWSLPARVRRGRTTLIVPFIVSSDGSSP